MSDRYAILGILSATGDLYQVPLASATTVGDPEVSPKAASSLTQTLLTSVIVCETGGAGASFSFSVVQYVDGDGDPTSELFNAYPVASGGTEIITLNLTLSPGDKLSFTKDSGALNATAFGVEMITGIGPRG